MTELNTKINFWRFPASLKFVVIWIFLLSIIDFWGVIDNIAYSKVVEVGAFIAAVAYFYLAIGLADRSQASRILTSISVGIGTAIRVILLILLFVYKGAASAYIEYRFIKYPIAQQEGITYLVLNVLFNLIILYILLRPSTKALFTRPSSQSALYESL